MSEEWRPVVGYEGYYEVSDLGQVRGVDRSYLSKNGRRLHYKSRILKQKFQQYYWRTSLTRQSVTTVWCVHRLVCEAFHGVKPSPTAVVRHLNGEHTDNRAENLQWGTCAENTADMMRHGRCYWSNKTHCKRDHEFTPENTQIYVDPKGRRRRVCRACKAADAASRPRLNACKIRRRKPKTMHACRVCGNNFLSAHDQRAFCSKDCKKASRRVDFKRGRLAA